MPLVRHLSSPFNLFGRIDVMVRYLGLSDSSDQWNLAGVLPRIIVMKRILSLWTLEIVIDEP
jgi:hypothetical protein